MILEHFKHKYMHFNRLLCKSNYSTTSNSTTSNNMNLVHWPLMGGMLHLVQRGGDLSAVLT